MNFSNPVRNADGTIDVEIDHPEYGEITFTASPDDCEEHGRLIYAAADALLPPWSPPEPSPAERRQALDDAVTAHRWVIETGGIELPGGVRVSTWIEDQNRLTSVIANAELAGVEQVDFKAASGWATLTLPELRAVAAAVALHVQASFSAERAHHEAIAALPDDALDDYDITSGWPPTAGLPQP